MRYQIILLYVIVRLTALLCYFEINLIFFFLYDISFKKAIDVVVLRNVEVNVAPSPKNIPEWDSGAAWIVGTSHGIG